MAQYVGTMTDDGSRRLREDFDCFGKAVRRTPVRDVSLNDVLPVVAANTKHILVRLQRRRVADLAQ
ncbi:hypothetical protein D3C86_2095970 [compost metagenome]